MWGLQHRYYIPVSFVIGAMIIVATANTQPPARKLIDSLQQALSASRSDSQRIHLLTRLSANYFGTKPDSGMLLGRQAIELSRKAGLPREEAEARIALAACLWGLGQHLQAIDEYRLTIPIAEKIGNRRLEARIQHGIAINYWAIDKKEKAITFLKRSLELQIQDGNDSSVMGCYHNLAQFSNSMGDKAAALQYYEQALRYAERAKHARGIAYTYMYLGSQYGSVGNETNSNRYLNQALDQFTSLRDTSGMAECWAVRGQIRRQQKRYRDAIDCFDQAIRLQRQVHGQYFRRVLSGFLMDRGSLYQQLPQTAASIEKSRQAWAEAFEIARSTEDWQAGAASAEALSQIYRRQGNYKQALSYFEEHIRHRDSFINIEKAKEMNRHELQTQYNDSISVMKKLQDKQLTIIKQDSALREARITQTRLYALVGAAMLALLLSVLLYRNRLQKLRFKNEMQEAAQEQERKAAALQKQIREATLSALQAQMNPHFIFNALNVIQSFVYAGEKEQASHLIGKFSDLVRQTLQFSRNALITLEEEIDFIRAYVELEMNRMAPDLSIQYEIDPNVPLGRIQLPPLLIQPFVENALRHGLYHKEGDRWLRISVEQKEKVVLVQIDDNGVGRTAAKSFSKDSEHLSFASGANAQRMALLNQLNDLQIDLRMLDKVAADGTPEGTTVQITITPINTP